MALRPDQHCKSVAGWKNPKPFALVPNRITPQARDTNFRAYREPRKGRDHALHLEIAARGVEDLPVKRTTTETAPCGQRNILLYTSLHKNAGCSGALGRTCGATSGSPEVTISVVLQGPSGPPTGFFVGSPRLRGHGAAIHLDGAPQHVDQEDKGHHLNEPHPPPPPPPQILRLENRSEKETPLELAGATDRE